VSIGQSGNQSQSKSESVRQAGGQSVSQSVSQSVGHSVSQSFDPSVGRNHSVGSANLSQAVIIRSRFRQMVTHTMCRSGLEQSFQLVESNVAGRQQQNLVYIYYILYII
jgi:hypothetical protein